MSYLKILLVSIIMMLPIQTNTLHVKAESKVELYQWPVPKGEIIDWKTIDEILPIGTRFQIVDVDTGLTFKVQRRAGGAHADVQPLTRKDTNIMKIIYKGKWSWKRNDIVIKVNDRYLAASMNGMPHGYGALQNGFPGHFCIHFQGSTTHKRKTIDLAHHLMIAKAGGELGNFTSKLNPLEIVQAYEMGINHRESVILKHILASEQLNPLKIFKYMRLDPSNENGDDNKALLMKVVHADGRVQVVDSNKLQRIEITFLLVRDSVINQWKIVDVSF